MIESIDVLVAALSAGAAAGFKDTASSAVKDAYAGLKTLTSKALRGKGDAQLADPEAHRDELRKALAAANADENAELVAAAQQVLALTDPEGTSAGKYRVDVHDNQGVQVGDGNTMTLNFGPQPRP